MILRLIAAALLLTVATLPAKAQTVALFDDDIRFGAAPLACTAAYLVMSEHAKTVSYGETFTPEAYVARAQAVAPGVVDAAGSADEANAMITRLAEQYWRYVNWARTTHAALDFDSFFRFLGRCDAVYGHAPGSEALSWQFQSSNADLYGNLPMDDESLVNRELGAPSFFDFRLFADAAACASSYRLMDTLLSDRIEGTWDAGEALDTHRENRRSFLAAFPGHRLGGIDFAARAEAAGANADPARTKEMTLDREAFLTLFFFGKPKFEDTGWVRAEFAAFADVLTRCDRRFGFHPRTRNSLAPTPFAGIDAEADCLALVDAAIDAAKADEGGVPPEIEAFRDQVITRSGASDNIDLHDLLQDQAIMERPYWEFEVPAETATARIKECFP